MGKMLNMTDVTKQEFSCTKKRRKCSICSQYNVDSCGETFFQAEILDGLCFFNCESPSIMVQKSIPTFKYQRKKKHTTSVSICTMQPSTVTKPSEDCDFAVGSDSQLVAAQNLTVSVSEFEIEATGSQIGGPIECHAVVTEPNNGNCSGEQAGFDRALEIKVDRGLNVLNVKDICSSPEPDLDRPSSSLKIGMDDTAHCFSSSSLLGEKLSVTMSEKDKFLPNKRIRGLREKHSIRYSRNYAENSSIDKLHRSNFCKICKHLESTSNMLICDNCEDMFHPSCCNPCVTRIPVGEWFCLSCVKKRLVIKKAGNECQGNENSESEGELGSLEFMFRETEPYMSNVRVGNKFQADVPYWSGPIFDESSEFFGNPLEINPPNYTKIQEQFSAEHSKLCSIGNWLQCQAVIGGIGDSVEGTRCGKWRRAPLFEVQTDSWECFCCISWDPARSDCAAPQELDTEEVMRQLKYMSVFRHRFAAKRRKVGTRLKNHLRSS